MSKKKHDAELHEEAPHTWRPTYAYMQRVAAVASVPAPVPGPVPVGPRTGAVRKSSSVLA